MFIFIYFLVYGGMNAYALWKPRTAFDLGTRGTLGLVAFGVFMVAGPILVRLMERAGAEAVARPIAMVVMLWFGFVFIFACNSLVADLYRGAAILLKGRLPVLPAGHAFWAVLAVSLIVFIYGTFEARGLRVERVRVVHPGLGSVIRVVQISDMHLGPTQGEGQLGRVLAAVRAEKPDIVVATGDIVDGLMSDRDGLAAMLASMDAPLGKFAVMGNHEYYAGQDYATAFHAHGGFKMLRDDSVRPVPGLTVIGADFRERFVPGAQGAETEREMIAAAPEGDLVLLLKHVPFVQWGPELPPERHIVQLSGHTHNGQIFPFNFITKAVYPYITGTYPMPGGGLLHVSRGTGTWGPPVRVLSPPELTVVDIVPPPAD